MASYGIQTTADKVQEFIQNLDYFVTFFHKNQTFVPATQQFTLQMSELLKPLRSIGQVNNAKTLWYHGAVVLPALQHYLNATMMFELWSAVNGCQKNFATASTSAYCQKVVQMVQKNMSGKANDNLFRYNSACLDEPASGNCFHEWNEARQKLKVKMNRTRKLFDDIIRVQIREYFKKTPVVVQSDLPVMYNRQEMSQILSHTMKSMMIEIQKRNQNLMDKFLQFLPQPQADLEQKYLQQDEQALKNMETKITSEIDAVKAQWKGQIQEMFNQAREEDIKQKLEEENRDLELKNALGLSEGLSEDLGDALFRLRSRIDGIESQVQAMMDIISDHQERFSQRLRDLELATVESYERQLKIQQTLEQQEEKIQDLQSFRQFMIVEHASIGFISLTVLIIWIVFYMEIEFEYSYTPA